MTLKLQAVEASPSVQQNFDQISQHFPIQAQDLGTGVPIIAPSPALQTRVVTGGVSSVGAILFAGTGGWTAARTGGSPTGDYTITFTTVLNSPPMATVTMFSGLTSVIALIVAPLVGSLRIQTINTAGALTDGAFSFIAVG